MPQPSRLRKLQPRKVLLFLVILLGAAFTAAATGQDTEPGGGHLGLPRCRHALEAPGGSQLGLAPAVPQAEKTCTNAPEPSEKASPPHEPQTSPPDETTSSPKPSVSSTPDDSGTEEEYLLTGQWVNFTRDPPGAHIVTGPDFSIYNVDKPSGHIELKLKVKRVGQQSVRVSIGVYSQSVDENPPPEAYASCQIYLITSGHPGPSKKKKVGKSRGTGGWDSAAFCSVD